MTFYLDSQSAQHTLSYPCTGLLGSLARSFVADPTFTPQIVAHVGIPTLLEWLGHVGMIAIYNSLHACAPVITPFVDKMVSCKRMYRMSIFVLIHSHQTFLPPSNQTNPKDKFVWKRRMEAWKFGSGNDYMFDE